MSEWGWLEDLERRGCEDHERKRLLACIRAMRKTLEFYIDATQPHKLNIHDFKEEDGSVSYTLSGKTIDDSGRLALETLAQCAEGKFDE
jgi:hypothetical protein